MTRLQTQSWPRPPRLCGHTFTWVVGHEEAAPVVSPVLPLAPEDFPRAFLGQPLGPWDFPPEPLSDFQMEPMSPVLPPFKPQPVVLVIELSSMATPRVAAASPLLSEYHPGANPSSEEDPSKEQSSAASCTPHEAGPSRRARRIEVISQHPLRIHTPHAFQGRGARGSCISRS